MTEEATESRQDEVRLVLVVTLFLNLFVAAGKLACGYTLGLVSLQADGFHSVFDSLSNIVGLVAISFAKRPPDPEHPYGHRKFEVAASIIIGLMVVLGMMEVGRGVYEAALLDSIPMVEPIAYAVVVATIITNAGVSFYEHRAGKRLGSLILQADAKHTLSDVVASMAVLVGIYLVDIGIAAGDVVASLVVMTFIGMTAYRVLRSSLDIIVDSALLNPTMIRDLVEAHPEVITCHFVRSRGMAGDVFLEFHMSMDPELTLKAAGQVMLDVKDKLRQAIPDLADITIQLEPHEPQHIKDVPTQLV